MNSDSDYGNNPYGGAIDSDIADLMGIDPDAAASTPDFGDLFGNNNNSSPPPEDSEMDAVDLSRTSFEIPAKFESDSPNPDFMDKNFYKKVLSEEGESSQRLHKLLTQFLNAQDPKDRSLYRGKLTSAYWNLMTCLAGKAGPGFSGPKRTAFRYGYLLPNIISAEQRQTLSKIIIEHDGVEPLYYMDEWLAKVGSGQINPSATDETKTSTKKDTTKIHSQLDRTRGSREIQIGAIRNKLGTLISCENMAADKIKILQSHKSHPDFPEVKSGYDAAQRQVLGEISNLLREMSGIDKDLTRGFLELEKIDSNYKALQAKAKEQGIETQVDSKVMINEMNTLRQLAKMSVGRQGNHFPILMKQYFRPNIREWGTRENIIAEMSAIEAIDPGVFNRTFKRQTNRIVPHVILLPCYGERGVCWEPFEKYNRATSRGRIGIPLYPKNLKEAVITALADLRWQVAKEKAQHYWMEEGLTGRYYDYFTDRRMKGDIKESFIQDYYLWITKESEGTQKLEKEARAVFWRYVPFPEEIRNSLKNRGFVYSELYKKDVNRSMSDGY